jgi:hypothetical protein
MKNGRILCVFGLLIAVAWAQDKAPNKKFHTSAAPPHHSLSQVEKSEHARANASSPLPAKSQLGHSQELSRLEHQSSTQFHAQSAAKNSRASATASHVHAEPTGHSSSINFNYHAPHNQSTAASGGRKH